MKRKLLLLNALLAGLLILGAAELYRQTLEAEARYLALEEPAGVASLPDPENANAREAVRQADYLPIARRLLFSEDRNSDVIVEAPEPEVVERPPLPGLSGLVDLGGGPTALMVPGGGGEPAWFDVGDKVGDYVFAGVEGDKVKMTWREQEFLVAREDMAEAPARAGESRDESRSSRDPRTRTADSSRPAAAAGANLTARSSGDADLGIGDEFAPGKFRALPGDDHKNGAEVKGYRKVIRQTPFGSQSWWEKKE